MSDVAGADGVTTQVETPPSFDDTLSAEIDRLFDAADQKEQLVEQPQEEGQSRGPDGKFTARAAEPIGQEQAQQEEVTDQFPEAPASWSADAKAHWPTLSPEVRKVLIDREAEAERTSADVGERLKGYESLERIVGPRRAALAQSFGSAEAAMEQLFALSDFAGRDLPGFVRWMCEQRGVDPRSLLQQVGQSQPADPTIAALLRKVDQLETGLSAREQAEQQEQDRQAAAAIEAFRNQKSDKGDKLNPHFDAVASEIGKLLKAGAVTGATLEEALAKAYKVALAADDKLQAQIKADEAKARKAEEEAEAKRKAEDARKRHRSDLQSSTGSTAQSRASFDETLMAEIDKRLSAA